MTTRRAAPSHIALFVMAAASPLGVSAQQPSGRTESRTVLLDKVVVTATKMAQWRTSPRRLTEASRNQSSMSEA